MTTPLAISFNEINGYNVGPCKTKMLPKLLIYKLLNKRKRASKFRAFLKYLTF